MSANVEKMALIGQPSWHGLEYIMPDNATINEWKQNAGLNFNVIKESVMYGKFIKSEHFFILYREDTNKELSIVGKNYKVVQPNEIINFFSDLIIKYKFKFETAGSLDGGCKVWALVRTGQSLILKGKDIINEFILLATSYDGSMSTTCKHTSVRVVCQNTLGMAINNKEPAIKVHHGNEFNETEVKFEMGLIEDEWCAFKENILKLINYKTNETEAQKIYTQILLNNDELEEEVYSIFYKDNKAIRDIMQVYKYAPGAENTLWGVVNGITGYLDHIKGNTADTRLNSAWFGKGEMLKNRTFRKVLSLL